MARPSVCVALLVAVAASAAHLASAARVPPYVDPVNGNGWRLVAYQGNGGHNWPAGQKTVGNYEDLTGAAGTDPNFMRDSNMGSAYATAGGYSGYEMLLMWPCEYQYGGTYDSGRHATFPFLNPPYVHWAQNTNPFSSFPTGGLYTPIDVHYSWPGHVGGFTGLGPMGSHTILDGQGNYGNWFFAVGQWGGWSTGIPGPQWYEPSLGTDHWAGVEWNELWVACSDAGVSDTCLPVQPRADECDPASAEPPAPANPDCENQFYFPSLNKWLSRTDALGTADPIATVNDEHYYEVPEGLTDNQLCAAPQ